MNRKLRCVIVDDEPIARYGIESYVRKLDGLNVWAHLRMPLSLIVSLRKLNVGRLGQNVM